ncbi:DUF3558 domain-containing protein [Nocardia transvalensis]|uniref:DUF3558 domain-containing protein n=1 Tax=Nocardia transvalensis TaxID=37333 RepID=UPI0018946120|nr:DUF3558 domain-containing protein [Nocardia transvalensis]
MSRTWKALCAVVLAVSAGVALVGCGKSTDGSPTSAPQTAVASTTSGSGAVASSAAAAAWDPCSIPDSAIGGLGLDVSTRDNKLAGTEFDGWKVCHWRSVAKTFDFAILSSDRTLAESRQRTDYQDYTDLTVGSHAALQFRPVGSAHDLECLISVEVPHGLVDFQVVNRYGAAGAGEPCAEVRRLSDALIQYLPS